MNQTSLRAFFRDLGSEWTPVPGHPRIETRKVPAFPKDRWAFVLDFEDDPSRGFTNQGEGSATTMAGALRELGRLVEEAR